MPRLNTEKNPFNGVGGDLATNVFFRLMVHAVMQREILAQVFVLDGLVGHDLGFRQDVGAQDRHDIGNAGAIDVEATRFAAATNQGQHDILVAIASARLGLTLDATNEGLIGLE
jgi:hypothetical protein